MRFLASGSGAGILADAQAHALIEIFSRRDPDSVCLWWAHDTECRAAAAVLESPGHTGFVMHCPLSAPGVRCDLLGHLLGAISLNALERGLAFVQVLLELEAVDEVDLVRRAGFVLVAELIYMRMDLPPVGESTSWGAEVSCRNGLEFSPEVLVQLIPATYRDSLDCPVLAGVRTMEDVIEGHKASGIYNPAHWWVFYWQGVPAGCILVNDDPVVRAADVVYAGVHPDYRRRGLASLMLAHGAREAHRTGKKALTLAVDAANEPALRLYLNRGFSPAHRRLAYALIRHC